MEVSRVSSVGGMLMAPVMMLVFYYMDQAFWPIFQSQPYGSLSMAFVLLCEGVSLLTLARGGGR